MGSSGPAPVWLGGGGRQRAHRHMPGTLTRKLPQAQPIQQSRDGTAVATASCVRLNNSSTGLADAASGPDRRDGDGSLEPSHSQRTAATVGPKRPTSRLIPRSERLDASSTASRACHSA